MFIPSSNNLAKGCLRVKRVEGLLVPARLPDGDMIVRSPDGKLGSNLVQVEVGAECQVPEAQKGSGRLDLIVVGAQQLFDIAECLDNRSPL